MTPAEVEAGAAATPAAAVVIDGITKRFRGPAGIVVALDGVSGVMRAGVITGLAGPDGAGKTTLIRVIAGLLRPDAGHVSVMGLDPGQDGAVLGTVIGYMPQRFGLYEDLTVGENLSLYADLRDVAPAMRPSRLAELLDLTGLSAFTGRLVGKLSGGMKQKLGLACALLGEPGVLLLDEPSVGVDPLSRRELWAMVEDLAGRGLAILWSTAYLDEAARCDRVLLLDSGRVLEDSTPDIFMQTAAGRSFRVAMGDGERRSIARRAAEVPGVIDTWVQGRSLRLVTAKGAPPPTAKSLGVDSPPLATAPRFEDAYIARLLERHPATTSTPAIIHVPPAVAVSADGPAIATHELSRTFGKFSAVEGVTFEVAAGEIFGLLGPNGAGKSTTFKMLCGLLPPTSGTARVAGFDMLTARADARARVGYMAQTFAQPGSLTVRQNLAFNASAYGLDRHDGTRRIAEAIDEFGLAAHADMPSGQLPLGLQRRLSLACAILHRPRILFLDEPTSGVDPIARREFWRRIDAMAEAGVTVLVTSHFMDEAEYCDRLGVIYRGRLIALGDPDTIKRQHATGDHATLEDAFVALIAAYNREHAP